MKLEGELAFFHSKMGVELDSQSFEFNDSDENSPTFKSRNQKEKEYDNKVSKNLKKIEHGFDSSPNDMKSANCMPDPKLEFYDSSIDLKNNYEAHVIGPKSPSSKDKRGLDPSPKLEFYDSMLDLKNGLGTKVTESINPVSRSSNDVGSFMMFATDKQSVKKSVTSPISNPLLVDKFQDSLAVFVDRTEAECEPELEICYKEDGYHVVKDICVDKGVYTKHKFMFEETEDGKAYNFFPLESFDDNQKPKDNTGIKVLNQPEIEDSDKVSLNHDQQFHVMPKDDDEIEDLIDNVTKAMDLHEDTHDSVAPDDKDEQQLGKHNLHSHSKALNDIVEEEVLASPALGLATDESNSDGVRSLTYHFGPSAPADCIKKEFHQLGGCNCVESHLPVMAVDCSSGSEISEIHHAETSQIRRGFGESSFSAAGAVSGRISYSGSIPYSGSISIRSDSSTTSTRSFAFPILQSEWNSSPVRMEKPDRSHYRKQRKWKNGLLCCKF